MTAVQMINFARKFNVAYSAAMQPLREELHMPQAAADILLFLSSNPTYHTASKPSKRASSPCMWTGWYRRGICSAGARRETGANAAWSVRRKPHR